jgi:cell division protein FtsI/penicillin-binding protein 2
MCRNQQPTRFGPNFERKICAAFISSTTPRALSQRLDALPRHWVYRFRSQGDPGVEASMEEYLHGQDGYRFIEHNRAGQEIVLYRGQERAHGTVTRCI